MLGSGLFVLMVCMLRACVLFLPFAMAAQVRPLDILNLKAPPAIRIAYGPGELQFGELRIPTGAGPHPVAMLIHGGCWVNKLPSLPVEATSLDLLRPMSAALAEAGIATWNVEYRRVGNPGGGWPGSLDDVRGAAAQLLKIAGEHKLDLKRAITAGHSAGGHLAQWIAAESRAPAFRAVINLDGPADLALARRWQERVCGTPAITNFIGGPPEQHPDRYRQLAAWPTGAVELIAGSLLQGRQDQVKFAQDRNARILTLPKAGHFDMLAPQSEHWPAVLERFKSLTQ